LQATRFERQRHHKVFEVAIEDFGVPEDVLDFRADCMPEPPARDMLGDDVTLDLIEGHTHDEDAPPKKRARKVAAHTAGHPKVKAKAKPKAGAASSGRRRGAVASPSPVEEAAAAEEADADVVAAASPGGGGPSQSQSSSSSSSSGSGSNSSDSDSD
jgi:hypothetical protein